ncbi:hypothetical protein [Mesorhizobium sp.]|uniref:hypothetical protein n=1 Tax=Mesorhizobium sp. TaxID=1871066 RepID=UPI000FE61467|nr:hypothetical protein [Mesorhizobium sp.]RWA59109.1 MAG: hypothetical protein EOQ27_26830 [Mesorhizobium sp.]
MAAYPIDEDRLSQIENAISTSVEQLQKVQRDFSKPNHSISTVSDLRKYLHSEFGLDNPKDLSGLILFMQGIHVRNSMDMDQVVTAIGESFGDWDLSDDFLKNWEIKKSIVAEIASSPIVKYVSKRAELFYRNHAHIHDLRIISEIRPVLDEDRKTISEFILFSKLHLTYSTPSENETYLELPIGLDELQRFQKEIEVALNKANVIQEELSKSVGRPTTPYVRRQRS